MFSIEFDSYIGTIDLRSVVRLGVDLSVFILHESTVKQHSTHPVSHEGGYQERKEAIGVVGKLGINPLWSAENSQRLRGLFTQFSST